MASKFAEDFAKKHIPSSQMGLRARVSQALDSAMEEAVRAMYDAIAHSDRYDDFPDFADSLRIVLEKLEEKNV